MAYPRAVADDHPTHHDRLARGYPGFRQAARPHGYPPVFFRALGDFSSSRVFVEVGDFFICAGEFFLAAVWRYFFCARVGVMVLRQGLRWEVCVV
jgi:hypothetical protein